MKKRRKRNFEEVVRGIANAEKDVDKVLKAARLARKEKPRWDEVDITWAVTLGIIVATGLAMYIGFIILILKS